MTLNIGAMESERGFPVVLMFFLMTVYLICRRKCEWWESEKHPFRLLSFFSTSLVYM